MNPRVLQSLPPNKILKKTIKKLASIRLAVIVIVSLAAIAAVGTVVESKYNAQVASKWVYQSFWMYCVLGLLAINLIAVWIMIFLEKPFPLEK